MHMGLICGIVLVSYLISSIKSFGLPPFPTSPNEFWEFALKQEYIVPAHIFLGVALFPEFKRPNGTVVNTGPFIGGLIATIGARDASGSKSDLGTGFGFFQPKSSTARPKGQTKEQEKEIQDRTPENSNHSAVQLVLKVLDFTFINLDGTILVEMDIDRPRAPSGVIVTLNPEKVIEKFATDFKNPTRWIRALSLSHFSDPKKFIHQYLQLFYPASIELNFHIKIQPMPIPVNKVVFDRLSSNTLKNKDYVSLKAPDATTFPPEDLGFFPKNIIELVDTETKQTAVEIHKWTMQVTHTDDEKFCQSATATKLTATFIKDIFDKFGRTETGQPRLPTKKPNKKDY